MNLEAWNIFKRLQSRLPEYNKNQAGKTVALVTPDKSLTLTATNTMAPGETTWDKVTGKPSMFPTTWTIIQDRPQLFSGSYSDLADKPTLFSGKYSDLAGAPNVSPAAQSGSYNDLTDKPSLFSGAYADLTGLPTLFDGKWTSITGKPDTYPSTWAQVADKPTFFSGAYADLAGKPVLFSGSYNDLTDKPAIPSMPNLAPVASTGRYSDLIGLPTLFNGTWAALTGKPTLFSGNYTDLTNKPDTVSTAAFNTALAAKADASTVKRTETYMGKTDANGLFTVTFATPFPTIPSVQPEPPAMANQVWVKVSATTTGFSLRLLQRNVVALLGIEVLLGATVNVNAGDARVVVIAQ